MERAGNCFGGAFHGVGGKVRIARGRLNLSVAKQLSDHRQSLAGRHRGRGESVPEIVDPSVLQPGPGTNPLPEGLQITEALPFQSTVMTQGLSSIRSAAFRSSIAGWPR